MNGKMRAGIMLRMAELPNTNRKITARLPVQNAIGRPSASSTPSEPNSRSVSHAISISKPMAQALPRVRMTMSLISLEMPCSSSSAAPIGIISFTGQYWTPHSVNETSPTLPD